MTDLKKLAKHLRNEQLKVASNSATFAAFFDLVPRRVSQGPFKQTEGFFTLYRGEVQKMPQKYQNLSQLSTAHFSGVLQAF